MLDNLFIFHPSSWIDKPWGKLSGLPLEDVWLTVNSKVQIFGWYVDAGANQPVLLWCHGNAGNITHRLSNILELYQRGISVMIFDYRGYGKSTGTPSEQGMYQDALTTYQYVTQEKGINPQRLVLFGRSLGSAIVAEVARQRAAAGLILEGAFPSIQSMADHHYLGLPSRWFVDSQFHLQKKLIDLSLPLLMVHGDRDSIVPIQLGKQVFEAARQPKRWYTVSGAGHNDVPSIGGRAYFQQLLTFIDHVTS